MGHPNLQSDINKALENQEGKPSLKLKALPVDSCIEVETMNTIYKFRKLKDGSYLAQGGKYIPNPMPVYIHGCTFGGSMIKTDVIEIGLFMEIMIMVSGKTITTSTVHSIKLNSEKIDE